MKSKAKTIRWIVGAILLAAIIGGVVYLDRLLDIATGYAAKNMASAVFVSGRAPQEVQNLDLSFSIIKKTRSKVDYEGRTVTSRLLWNRIQASYLKEKAEDLDESDRTLASYGLDVSKVRIKAFNKATEASDVRCFVRNTLCWPDRYVKMVCPELIPLFDEIVEFLDKDSIE